MPIDNLAKIQALESQLDSGVEQTSVDGLTVRTAKHQDIRNRILELKAEDDTGQYDGFKRRFALKVWLGK